MPSTPDSILRLELQATGENANTWGTKTNNTIELLGQAIAGAANVNVGGSGNYTLVASNYTTDEARAATLVLTGTLSGNRDVIVPSSPKHYTIINQTSGAFPLTIRQVSGTGVAIPTGSSQIVCTSTTCVGVGINNVSRAGDTMTGALGVIAGTAAAPGLFPAGDTNTGAFFPSADVLGLSTDGTERMRIDASGNVGIGTSSPNQKLQVTGSNSTGFAGATLQNSNGNVGIAGIQFSSDTTYSKAAIGQLRQNPNGVGPLVFYVDSAVDAADWSTGDEKMRITADGNVGIGTSTPAHKLQVNGAIVSTDGTTVARMSTSGGVGLFSTLTNHPLAFQVNDVERMRINPSGDVEVLGNLRFNSGYGSAGIAYGVRAWVNFNGTGTVAIRASGNVTSITDNGTGDYTINFTNAMPDANYAIVGTTVSEANGNSTGLAVLIKSDASGVPVLKTTSQVQIITGSTDSNVYVDAHDVNIIVVR